MCFREHSTCDRLVMALLLLEMISEMLFLISSQMELLFASSLLNAFPPKVIGNVLY